MDPAVPAETLPFLPVPGSGRGIAAPVGALRNREASLLRPVPWFPLKQAPAGSIRLDNRGCATLAFACRVSSFGLSAFRKIPFRSLAEAEAPTKLPFAVPPPKLRSRWTALESGSGFRFRGGLTLLPRLALPPSPPASILADFRWFPRWLLPPASFRFRPSALGYRCKLTGFSSRPKRKLPVDN